jgi:WD40 repeat protein
MNYGKFVALHPFYPLLATGNYDNTAKLWLVNYDGTETTCTATLKGHTGSVSSVAFHPRLPLLVTGSHDNSAKFWMLNPDSTAATCTATLEGHTCVISSVAFHPHLPLLATGSRDQTAKLWLINSNGTSATCTVTLGGHSRYGIDSVTFHPCLPLLATICADFSLKVWVINSEGTAATCTASLKGKGFGVIYRNSVTFHPRLPLLAANCADKYNNLNMVKLWLLNSDYTSATCAATLVYRDCNVLDCIVFHPFLPLLAIRSHDSSVKLWLLNSEGTAATCTSTLQGLNRDNSHFCGSLAFHPRLPLLATVTYSLRRSRMPTTDMPCFSTRSVTFRFRFCPEPRPQMPVVHMLAGGGTHCAHAGTASEHGGSGCWTEGGVPFSMNLF